MRIGVVAPACPIDEAVAHGVAARAAALYGRAVELVFHPQCFLSDGHFAGDDPARIAALVEIGEDPTIDAVWFARGGYGAARIVEQALGGLGLEARAKSWLGYSDTGTLLGALYGAGFTQVAHGPMPADIRRAGGEAAIDRSLRWLVERAPDTLEPTGGTAPRAAFNLTILSTLIGTPWQPDLTGHELLIEEVSEHLYRIDRTFAHITANPGIRRLAGLRLGRISDVTENDRPFGYSIAQILAHWCDAAGIAWLGTADIGHDTDNKVVPFG